MAIPNLNLPTNNINQTPYNLDLVPASQLVVEPICSWRLQYNPQLELKVSSDGKNIRYSVYNHHSSFRCYWPNSASSSNLTSIFAHCVWKDTEGKFESRLFSGGRKAVLLSVDPQAEKIGVREWMGNYLSDFLITRNLAISAINDDASLDFQEELREVPRTRSYDPEAEEGMIRYRRTEEGDLVVMEGKPVTEKTAKVWSSNRDIRLVKVTAGLSEKIACKSFNWRNNQTLQISCRFAPGSVPNYLPELNVDAIIQHMQTYTPQLETIKNEELITFYKKHPLDCFMPDYGDLSTAKATAVQKWVYQQFYRKEGENIKHFEYSSFVSAKKIVFSFGKKGVRSECKSFPEIDAWHIEMKRQGGWVLQFPIGICDFFSGIFLTSAQNPSGVDEEGMERLVQGVPLLDEERNKIIDDFAVELGACSVINFYVACDRSESQLEIDGRVWVRSFGNAGRGIRGTVGRVANLLGGMHIEDVNRGLENAVRLGENINRARGAWDELQGRRAPPPENPQVNR